jgi:hypothetical protein
MFVFFAMVFMTTAMLGDAQFVTLRKFNMNQSTDSGNYRSSSLLLHAPGSLAIFTDSQQCSNEQNSDGRSNFEDGLIVDVTPEVVKRQLTSLTIACNMSTSQWNDEDPYNFNFDISMFMTTPQDGVNWPVPFEGNCSVSGTDACMIPYSSIVSLASLGTSFAKGGNDQSTASVVVRIPPKTPIVLGVTGMTRSVCMFTEDASSFTASCEVLWK